MATPDTQTSEELAALLQWHVDIGASDVLNETACNWFDPDMDPPQKQEAILPAQKPAPTHTPSRPVFTPDDQAILSAKELAASCKSFDDIEQALMTFDGCNLKKTAQNLVLYDGNPDANILLLGEAPGADEDREGKPFVGRSGKLLDKMLEAIGLSRSSDSAETSVCISNIVFWRPPGNRKPTDLEAHLCLPFVEKLIEIMAPDIIVCLGATPSHRLVGGTQGILRMRGKWQEYNNGQRVIPVLPTLHPAYLLRAPAQKKLSWQDFLSLREKHANL